MSNKKTGKEDEYRVLEKNQLECVNGGVEIKKKCRCRKCGAMVDYSLYVRLGGLCYSCFQKK